MSDLTTVGMVKRQLGIGSQGTVNTVDDDLLGLYVTQASQMIETECSRVFSASVGTQLYDAAYPVVCNNVLYFDQDYIGVDAVWNGANGTLDPSTYRLLPLRYAPKYGLQLLVSSNDVWVVGNNGYAQQAIGVIGTTGFCKTGEQPADITLAATRLASWLYQNRDNDGSTVQIADGSIAIPAQAPTFVLRTISKYIRRTATAENSYA